MKVWCSLFAKFKRQLAARLDAEVVLSLVRTFPVRCLAAFGGMLLFVVLGRLYGPAGVGVFALAQSIYIGAGILARFGLDNALMRYVGQSPSSPCVKTYLCWALLRSSSLSLVAAALVFLVRDIAGEVFDMVELPAVLVGIALAIPAFTLSTVLAGFMKGARKPATSCLLENGAISLVSAIVVMALAWAWPQAGISAAGWAFAIAAWPILGLGAWRTFRQLPDENPHVMRGSVSKKEFGASSNAFFVMSLASFMQQVVAIMIAGWFLSADDMGLFRAAERTAFLISFILLVINAVFPPRFAALYHQADLPALEKLARQGVLLGGLLAIPLLLVCLFAPEWALGFFGEGFVGAANLLRILAVAQLVNVATGSVGFLLNMTGYEKLMRNIALIFNASGLLLFIVLTPVLGSMGAASALAFTLVAQNVTALVFVWRRLGIWMLPVPNFLAIVGVTTRVEVSNTTR